jgi:hypothetical protein
MRTPLSDDQLRDLLKATYAPRSRTPASTVARRAIGRTLAVFLLGAAAGALVHRSARELHADRDAARLDPIEAVQAAGTRYAEALSGLGSTRLASADSAVVAREVVATSLVGVTRSLLTVVGSTPAAIDLYRLASEVHHEASPASRDQTIGAEF